MAVDGSLSFDILSEQDKEEVYAFAPTIDLLDHAVIRQYGSNIYEKINSFTDEGLKLIKTKDTAPIGEYLTALTMEMDGFDADKILSSSEQKKGLSWLSRKGKDIKKSIERYKKQQESVQVSIEQYKKLLIERVEKLSKDEIMYSHLYDKYLEAYNELIMYILAGREKLRLFCEDDIIKQEQKVTSTNDQMEAEKLSKMNDAKLRFEKKISDLNIQVIAVQISIFSRAMQNSDNDLIDGINSFINNVIPFWKTNILMALGAENVKLIAEQLEDAKNKTDEMLKNTSGNLTSAIQEAAKVTERSIIGIDAVKAANKSLTDAIVKVKDIQQNSQEARVNCEKELSNCMEEIRKALLS